MLCHQVEGLKQAIVTSTFQREQEQLYSCCPPLQGTTFLEVYLGNLTCLFFQARGVLGQPHVLGLPLLQMRFTHPHMLSQLPCLPLAGIVGLPQAPQLGQQPNHLQVRVQPLCTCLYAAD